MALQYQKELNFMTAVLHRMRLRTHLLAPEDHLETVDDGLRRLLGLEEDYGASFRSALHWTSSRTIYKLMDQFLCNYLYLHLPGTNPTTTLVIGPYLTIDPTRDMLLEQTERLGLPLHLLDLQADYYASLPVFNTPAPIMALVSSFGEVLWGSADAFDMVDVNHEQVAALPQRAASDAPIEQADILQQMKQMEERYAYEDELIRIVANGLTHQAEMIMSSVSSLNYQPRHADPLRNMKNYCIICNTLLRKAAQKGGVHPIYLDKMSSQFARTIENTPTLEVCSALIGKMIRTYCRLVRTHANKHYSAIIDRTLAYISSNLSGDLRLTALAGIMQVSPGYLSTIFHREKGETLTGYITASRMKAAHQMLLSTRLQVQTISQLCGYADPNYFARHFRRYYGVTPLRCRKDGAALHTTE